MTALADSTHGYVGADLAALCSEAAMHALRRVVSRMAAGSDRGSAGVRGWAGQAGEAEAVTEAVGRGELDNVGLMSGGECVGMDDMRFAETRVRPSALKEMAVEVPRVRWSDVGGLDTGDWAREGGIARCDTPSNGALAQHASMLTCPALPRLQ